VDLTDALYGCIEKLTQKQRQAVLLHYVRELTEGEIAVMLGISQPAVNGRLKGARKSLRQCMREKGYRVPEEPETE
jgi:RNA polymerase sigma factor (sigma-70 family)